MSLDMAVSQALQYDANPLRRGVHSPCGTRNNRLARSIIASVAAENNLSSAVLVGPSRVRHYSRARFQLYFELRVAGFSYPEIGRITNRDHATVISGCRRFIELAVRAATT